MPVWGYILVKICIIRKLAVLVIRNTRFHMVQVFTENYFETNVNHFPKDFNLKRPSVAEQKRNRY